MTTDQTTTNANGLPTEKTLPTPAWATRTIEPDDGGHSGEVTVGPVTLHIEQVVPFNGEIEPIFVWMPEEERILGAQACRDLAAALMEAARVIDNAAERVEAL